MQAGDFTSRRARLSPLVGWDFVCAFMLGLTAFALYSPTLQYGFFLLDDHLYVVGNYQVHRGVTLAVLRNALTSFSPSNWHPITLISHALDCSLYGLSPMGHHATNVLLHSLASGVLFLFLRRVQANRTRALIVAALFAFHPLQVETVAWISSRKGLLSTLFAFLTLWAHTEFACSRRRLFYFLGLMAGGLALASKSMVVTLPVLLLIIDYWPLKRWPRSQQSEPVNRANQARAVVDLILEKVPYALLSAGCIILTLRAHGQERVFHEYSWPARIANAFHSYLIYLEKTIWPSKLSIYYPHSGESFDRSWFAVSVILVLVLFLLAWRYRTSRPAFISGWLWYFVSLLPVIGLIPIDGNGWADRYAYLPLVGIFWAVTWMIPDRWLEPGIARRAVALSACLVLAALMAVTFAQIRLWRDNEALFGHALKVSNQNAVAHAGYGAGRAEKGDLAGAERHLRLALKIDPGLSWAGNLLGTVLLRQGRTREALTEFQRWADSAPSILEWRSNAAQAACKLGQADRARGIWKDILRERPGEPSARAGLGLLALNAGDLRQARSHFLSALETSPYYADAWKGLGYAAIESKHYDEAVVLLNRAIELSPTTADDARLQLAKALNSAGRYSEAERVLQDLVRREQNLPDALGSLAWCLVMRNRSDEAVVPLKRLVDLRPRDTAALHSLGRVLAALNRPHEALPYLERVTQLEPNRPGLQADLARVRLATKKDRAGSPAPK